MSSMRSYISVGDKVTVYGMGTNERELHNGCNGVVIEKSRAKDCKGNINATTVLVKFFDNSYDWFHANQVRKKELAE